MDDQDLRISRIDTRIIAVGVSCVDMHSHLPRPTSQPQDADGSVWVLRLRI